MSVKLLIYYARWMFSSSFFDIRLVRARGIICFQITLVSLLVRVSRYATRSFDLAVGENEADGVDIEGIDMSS